MAYIRLITSTLSAVRWSCRGEPGRFSPDPAADLAARRRSLAVFFALHAAAAANLVCLVYPYGMVASLFVGPWFFRSFGNAVSEYLVIRRHRLDEIRSIVLQETSGR